MEMTTPIGWIERGLEISNPIWEVGNRDSLWRPSSVRALPGPEGPESYKTQSIRAR